MNELNYLSEEEKNQLIKLADNEVLVSALKKVLLSDIYESGVMKKDEAIKPMKNWVFQLAMDATTGQDFKMTDDELGEKVRACIEGIRTVEIAFKRIEQLKVKPAIEIPIKNEAR